MGCVQAKPSSTNSPPTSLHKLKTENGYSAKRVGVVGPRRSTGQRYDERRFGHRPRDGSDDNAGLIGGEERENTVNGGNVSRRIFIEEEEEREEEETEEKVEEEEEEEELAQGWPKWLLENVPKKVLAGLVPKSAESYDKLDKVITLTFFDLDFCCSFSFYVLLGVLFSTYGCLVCLFIQC